MKTMHKPLLIATAVVLVVASGLAVAQTPPPAKPTGKSAAKTLSGKAAGGGKLMTRDELRGCLKRLDDLNAAAKNATAQRETLDAERDELKAVGETLKNERAEVDRQAVEVKQWNERMRALAAEIEDFNKRSGAVQDAPSGQQQKMADDLKSDRERLQKAREALAADETRIVPVYQSTAKAYNERAMARDAKVEDWNKRNAAAGDASIKQQEDRALWLNECANRPYREDDEQAIRAGK